MEKLLKKARDVDQRPLMSKIRMEGDFKALERPKKPEEPLNKPKFNLICIGKVGDAKTRVIISEKAQPEQKWSTTTLRNAPPEIQQNISKIASEQPKHKRMLTMTSKSFTFECQAQIK